MALASGMRPGEFYKFELSQIQKRKLEGGMCLLFGLQLVLRMEHLKTPKLDCEMLVLIQRRSLSGRNQKLMECSTSMSTLTNIYQRVQLSV